MASLSCAHPPKRRLQFRHLLRPHGSVHCLFWLHKTETAENRIAGLELRLSFPVSYGCLLWSTVGANTFSEVLFQPTQHGSAALPVCMVAVVYRTAGVVFTLGLYSELAER